MPRVKHQKAAKDYPEIDVKKGEVYYKWSFRYGGTRKSKTYPRASQLTQSKYSEVYAAMEAVEDFNSTSLQEFVEELRSAAETIRGVAEEYESADQDMGGHGGVNQERADYCEQCAQEFDDLADRFDDMEFGEDEEFTDEEDALAEARGCAEDITVDEA